MATAKKSSRSTKKTATKTQAKSTKPIERPANQEVDNDLVEVPEENVDASNDLVGIPRSEVELQKPETRLADKLNVPSIEGYWQKRTWIPGCGTVHGKVTEYQIRCWKLAGATMESLMRRVGPEDAVAKRFSKQGRIRSNKR